MKSRQGMFFENKWRGGYKVRCFYANGYKQKNRRL